MTIVTVHTHPTSRQRSPRTDPDMRDGDSGHGNPGEPAGDRAAYDTDSDTGDMDERTDAEADAGAERQTGLEEMRAEYDGPSDPPVGAGEPGGHALPVRDYARLSVPEVLRRVRELPPDRVSELLTFELSHRNRKTLVARLTRLVEGGDHGGRGTAAR